MKPRDSSTLTKIRPIKFSVVFKNIHPTITVQEIIEDLQHNYPSIISVTRLYKNNVPIPVIAAEFNGSQSIEQVLQINQICNISVKPERRRRPKGPVQCMRCLDFGHTKNNCNNSIACIFCSKDHYSVNCPQKDLPPTCRHCNGSHRADLRSIECPYYKKLIDSPSNNPNSGNNKTKSRNNPPQGSPHKTFLISPMLTIFQTSLLLQTLPKIQIKTTNPTITVPHHLLS